MINPRLSWNPISKKPIQTCPRGSRDFVFYVLFWLGPKFRAVKGERNDKSTETDSGKLEMKYRDTQQNTTKLSLASKWSTCDDDTCWVRSTFYYCKIQIYQTNGEKSNISSTYFPSVSTHVQWIPETAILFKFPLILHWNRIQYVRIYNAPYIECFFWTYP